MAYADLEAPEVLLRNVLVECQVWRAIVANPGATWPELAVILDAGTVAAGGAADAVVYGAFAEVPDDPRFKQRPRANIRQLADDSWERTSTTGFSFSGQLDLIVDISIPDDYAEDVSGALLDARRKAKALERDLLLLPRAGGRLDIKSVSAGVVGLSDPKGNGGDQFAVLDWTFSYMGAF